MALALEPLPTVFISYAHGDDFTTTIRQRLDVLLRRTLEDHGARLFVDSRGIGTGNQIDPAVVGALHASVAAILLVNPLFLNSDYIRNIELPLILERRAAGRLRPFPILIEDCLWASHPELKGMLFAGGGSKPLIDIRSDRSRLSRFLADVAREVLEALPAHRRPATPSSADSSVASANPRPVDHDSTFVRELDQAKLLALLLAAPRSEDALSPLQLCGPGGTGKTVLANALVKDKQIRDLYPDGIYWVTLGESSDSLSAQDQLAQQLGLDVDFTTPLEGAGRLSRALWDKRALVVLDDARTQETLRPLIVTGPAGATLITSRRPLVADAPVHYLSELDQASSAAFLRRYLPQKYTSQSLPKLIASSQGLPLTLALLGSAIQSGQEPRALEASVDEPDIVDHPLSSALTVINAIAEQLDQTHLRRLRSLLVFRQGQKVPHAVIAAYWSAFEQTLISEAQVVGFLADMSSLRLIGGETVGSSTSIDIHDLTRDSLHYQLDVPLERLHGQLIDSVADMLGITRTVEWSHLPEEHEYLWNNLAFHLESARRPLADVIVNSNFIARRAIRGGWASVFSDLERALHESDQYPRVARTIEALRRAVSYLDHPWTSEDLGRTLTLWVPTLQNDTSVPPPASWEISSAALPLPSSRPQQQSGVFFDSGWALCVAPMGEVLIVGTATGSIFEMDSTTFFAHRKVAQFSHSVRAVGSTSSIIAAGLADGTLAILTGARIAEHMAHAGGVRCITTNGPDLVTGGDDGFVLRWQHPFESPTILWAQPNATTARAVISMTSHATRGLAWGLDNGDIYIRSSIGHTVKTPINLGAEVTSLQYSDDGSLLAAGSREGSIAIWSTQNSSLMASSPISRNSANGLTFDVTGTHLAVGWESGELTWHALPRLEELNRFEAHASVLRGMSSIPPRDHIATVGDDGAIRLWRLSDLADQAAPTARLGRCRAIAGYAPADVALVASEDGSVSLCELSTGEIGWRKKLHLGPVLAVAPSVAGGRAMGASAGADRRLCIFDLLTGRVLAEVENAHADWIRRLVFSQSRLLLSVSDDGSASVRSYEDPSKVETQVLPGLRVRAACFAPDGHMIVLGASDGRVYVWRPFSNRSLESLSAHRASVRSLAFSSDGKYFVSGSDDGVLRAWTWPEMKYAREMVGPPARVRATCFGDQSAHFFAGDSSGFISAWRLGSGMLESKVRVASSIRDLCWLDDGRRLLFASDEGWGSLRVG